MDRVYGQSMVINDEVKDILLETIPPLMDVMGVFNNAMADILDYIGVVLGKKEVARLCLNFRTKKQLDDIIDMIGGVGDLFNTEILVDLGEKTSWRFQNKSTFNRKYEP